MYRVGIDLGGTNIAVGIVNEEKKLLHASSIPTALPLEPEALAERIAGFVWQVLAEAEILPREIEAAGIGIPGTVNPESGVVEYANNFDFVNVAFLDLLKPYFDFPLAAVNDAQAAAWGEYIAGAGQGASSMVMITLGTGVGGAAIFDGKPMEGYNFAAGEIGHMVIERNGRACTCGRKGCFEAYASATALVEDAGKAALENQESLLYTKCGGRLSDINGRLIFEAAAEGDETAKKVLASFLGYLAEGTANIINIFQPEIVCIGGGISGAGEALLAPLREAVKPMVYSRNSARNAKIVRAELGNNAGIIGAAFCQK